MKPSTRPLWVQVLMAVTMAVLLVACLMADAGGPGYCFLAALVINVLVLVADRRVLPLNKKTVPTLSDTPLLVGRLLENRDRRALRREFRREARASFKFHVGELLAHVKDVRDAVRCFFRPLAR